MLKPKVVTLMLEDHPEAITFLKKEKVLPETVLLPSAQTLHEYLKDDFSHLADKTELIQKLANQTKYPTEIFMIIDSQVNEYAKLVSFNPELLVFNLKVANKIRLLIMPNLTKIILQKHPKAIEFLINDELLAGK
jgi:hypothetical protein